MKDFERDYEAFEKIKEAYGKAMGATDEAGEEKARADYKVWADGIEAKGRDYADTFRIYKDSRDNGNPRPDISEPYQTRDVERLLSNLRAFGIEEFTFSSGWSSSINTSWTFLQNGCELAGMVEVFTGHTKFMSEEKETAPAFLFRIK